MRKFVLIAAMVLASASAQAGESRSLSADPIGNDTTSAVASQPASNKALHADNDIAAPSAETPRYSAPADTTSTAPPPPPPPPTTGTPHYTARPAPVESTWRATTTTATRNSGSDDLRELRGRHANAGRPHGHARWTAGRIIATLHRYGVYW